MEQANSVEYEITNEVFSLACCVSDCILLHHTYSRKYLYFCCICFSLLPDISKVVVLFLSKKGLLNYRR